MRRLAFFVALFAASPCFSQDNFWQIEVMPGIAAYKGDLTKSDFPLKTIGPSLSLNLKYDRSDMIVLRFGLGWAKLSADDQNNKQDDIKRRNLNFKTNIIEANLAAEVNLLDPEMYYSYPYLLTGIGVFHFDPYSYDKNGQKTYLQPLSTEGQGLPEYPARKKYSLTQIYIPFGGGWKLKVKEKYIFSFEMAVRYIFTDYLDDVSATYVNANTLRQHKGDKAVEMAYRQVGSFPNLGDQRGNPDVKDLYFFSGFKIAVPLGKTKKPLKRVEEN
jgi:hypothetical protein